MRRLPFLFLLLGFGSRISAAELHRMTEAELGAAAARIDAVVEQVRSKEAQRDETRGSKLPPRATDQAFLRRVCIDLAGRLPLADEVRAFLADCADDKRARLIDRLVLEPGAAETRFHRLAEALRVVDKVGNHAQEPFIAWLRQAMVDDRPYDALMSAMLRAELDDDPASGLLRRDEGDVLRTSTELARAVLGADLHCAQCHDHPYSFYTQRECIEFAACFVSAAKPAASPSAVPVRKPKTLFPGATPFGRGGAAPSMLARSVPAPGLTLPSNYKYRDGKPGDPVAPRYLRLENLGSEDPSSAFTSKSSTGRKMRGEVALWFTGPQNTRFAAVRAWREWEHLFGSVAPMPTLREGEAKVESYHSVMKRLGCDRPPMWSPVTTLDWVFDRDSVLAPLVAVLGIEFKRSGYRIREFQRVLARTEAYQGEASGLRFPHTPLFLSGAPVLRRLPPDVIWDAWVRWLPENDEDAKPSADLPQVPPVTHPLRLLGRGTREWADETVPVISHGLARFMMNSPLVERVAHSRKSTTKAAEPSAQVAELFLDIMGRYPIERETAAALRHLAAHPKTGTADLAWALLNTAEFLFIP